MAASLATLMVIALFAAAAVLLVGQWRVAWSAPLALLATLGVLLGLLGSWYGAAHSVVLSWVPSLGVKLALRCDGLTMLYGLVAAGVGALVVVYSSAYMPHHLKQTGRSERLQIAYYTWLLLFLAAMLGLALAEDLILLFLFFDLTAVCSYFLIGFERNQEARSAALCALLVTGVTSVAMLLGILLLYADYHTFSISQLIREAQPGASLNLALGLIALAALAKSAQFPLHFWLPRAMAAPAPVSAYLHSAAMVAAGVFVLHRLHPLLELAPGLRAWLLGIALCSIVVGSLLALHADDLKRILAYSTIAQYGYVTLLLALGGAQAAAAAAFYVLVHALCKSALFMLAGAVETATGERSLRRLGGLARRQPLLAGLAAIAAATLAGLPLSAGFLKDELFFKLALEHSLWLGFAATAAAALTLTYSWRFWQGIFLGELQTRAQPLPWRLLAPIALLAGLCLLGGIYIAPALEFAAFSGAQLYQRSLTLEAGYHFAFTAANAMALGAYGGATLLWLGRRYWQAPLAGLLARAEGLGPDRLYHLSLEWLARFADWLHGIELRDLRDRIAGVLLPAGVMVAMALVARGGIDTGEFRIATVFDLDAAASPPTLISVMLCLAAGSGLLVVRQREHLALILTLTGVGFTLALVYALLGAPDVALVAVLMETVLTLLLLTTLRRLPQQVLRDERQRDAEQHVRRWHTAAGLAAGGLVFVLSWVVLSEPAAESVANRQLLLSPQAHADNVVAAILVDFRGLDTLGEATVIFVALLGAVTLLRRPRRARSEE